MRGSAPGSSTTRVSTAGQFQTGPRKAGRAQREKAISVKLVGAPATRTEEADRKRPFAKSRSVGQSIRLMRMLGARLLNVGRPGGFLAEVGGGLGRAERGRVAHRDAVSGLLALRWTLGRLILTPTSVGLILQIGRELH